MKKRLYLLLAGLAMTLSALAQDRLFAVTDRNTYLAGDLVYCSLFCADDKGVRSGFSAVAYLELVSAEGTVAEAKVGLFDGRGAGSFRIPLSAPTGNYALVAYTARSAVSLEDARRIAVFNTTSTARVKEGVTVEEEFQPTRPEEVPAVGGLTLSFPARLRQGRNATLLLGGLDQDASLSVSVYHEDGLAPADGKSLQDFLKGGPALPGPRSGEYEGEIVYATVEGLDHSREVTPGQATAFLSSAGAPANVYVGRNTADGRLQFYTGNIYGDRELVCEVVTMDGQDCHINLTSPFRHPDPGKIPALVLSPSQRSALVARKASLRENGGTLLDTLTDFMPKREDLLLESQNKIRYHLDDYTRFPTVREICVEFIKELQFVRRDGRWQIRQFTSDATDSRRYVQDNVLVMMDGVVLTDHGMLQDFDALLLEDVDIYPQPVSMGGVPFGAVVNFVTKKNYVTALKFPENVRVVDFKGVSYPVYYPGTVPAGQDLREVLFWHPILEIAGGQSRQIGVTAPAYEGSFRIVVEGWKADGTPVQASYSFEVE